MSKGKKYSRYGSDLGIRDLQYRQEQLERHNMRILQLDELDDLLRMDGDRRIYIDITKKRVAYLLQSMLERPLSDKTDDLIWHGEVRGRLMEQIHNADRKSVV